VKEKLWRFQSSKEYFGSRVLVARRARRCASLPLVSRAQDTGYISGTVTDKSGAAVVAADVTVKSVGGA